MLFKALLRAVLPWKGCILGGEVPGAFHACAERLPLIISILKFRR